MKRIVLLLFVCFLFSCKRKESNFSEEMIKELALRAETKGGRDSLPPPPIILSNVYLLTDSDQIILLNENELFFFYKNYYSKEFESFTDFLNGFLNNGILINKRVLADSKYPIRFKLNSKIEKEYSDLGFDKFFKKYSKQSNRKEVLELNKADLKNNEYLTIAYLLYMNRYDISQDCYLGKDYIRKREDSFK